MRRMRGLGGSWILDRTWYEDAEIFARGLFEQGSHDVRRVDRCTGGSTPSCCIRPRPARRGC